MTVDKTRSVHKPTPRFFSAAPVAKFPIPRGEFAQVERQPTLSLKLRFLIEERLKSLVADLPRIQNGFGAADKENSAGFERLEEIAIELSFRLFREVNDDVAAKNQIKISLEAVFKKVMAFEVDGHFNFGLDGVFSVGRLGEIFDLAVRTHGFNFFGGVNAFLCLGDNFDVQIGGKDSVTFAGRKLAHDYRQGIRLRAD